MYKEEYNRYMAFATASARSHQEGMTLLDYLAGQAAQGLSMSFSDNAVTDKGANLLAQESYLIAAAMMEERKKYLQAE